MIEHIDLVILDFYCQNFKSDLDFANIICVCVYVNQEYISSRLPIQNYFFIWPPLAWLEFLFYHTTKVLFLYPKIECLTLKKNGFE